MDIKARCVSLSAGLLFALLALLCCFGAISIDEAWSIQHLQTVDSLGEIVFTLKHDNNHVLNTIQLYVLGAGHTPWVYRLFPLFFGVGTVVLLLYLAAGQGFTSLGLCAGLTAFSYPLIYYAAEARGYAPMLFFAVLAFWLTQQVLAGRKSGWLFPAFWLTAVLMVLAHFSSLILLASLAIYACAAVCFAQKEARRSLALRLVLSQGPALLLALGYYLYFRAGMIVGGGPESHPLMVAASAICQAFGFPNPAAQPLALGVVIAYVLALGAALFRLRRRQPAEAIFFGMICFVVPAVSILLNPTGNLYFRYFLVALPFLYLLVARVLAKLVTGRRWLRWPVVGVVLVVMGLHQVKTLELMQWGRGGYDQAIFDMLEASDYAPLRLSSDHEFRTTVLLDFYAASYGLQNHLLYDSLQDGVTRAEWFVVHQLAWNAPPEPRFAEGAVIFDQFAFYRYYPAHGPTGIAWYVFRRSTEDAP